MQELVQLTWVFNRSFSMSCASFSMLDGPGGTGCDVPVRGCWVIVQNNTYYSARSRWTKQKHRIKGSRNTITHHPRKEWNYIWCQRQCQSYVRNSWGPFRSKWDRRLILVSLQTGEARGVPITEYWFQHQYSTSELFQVMKEWSTV